jgi:hypothetical protein
LGGVGWLGKKRGAFPFSPFFSFLINGDLSRIFSQENIFQKPMSFFGDTKHGKISTQKNYFQNLKKK